MRRAFAFVEVKTRNRGPFDGRSGIFSLETGLNTLDKFGWIGAFSAGGMTEEFDKTYPALDSRTTEHLRLLWVACCTDDGLIDINRKLRAWLASKNIKYVDVETPGAHTGWSVAAT